VELPVVGGEKKFLIINRVLVSGYGQNFHYQTDGILLDFDRPANLRRGRDDPKVIGHPGDG